MFQYLRVNNGEILSDAILKRLGKVNVVCGKNNSGKSTLLNGIENRGSRRIYKTLQDKEIDYLCDNSILPDCKKLSGFPSLFRERLSSVADKKPMWTLDDRTQFTQRMVEITQHNSSLSNCFNLGGLVSAYDKLLADNFRAVLLPPKRKLETTKQVDTKAIGQPGGSGILNWLFFAKNQPETSDERLRLDKLKTAFKMISSGYDFEVFLSTRVSGSNAIPNNIDLFFARESEGWIGADQCGLGLQDLMVILYFALSPGADVVLVEEPENHMHPDMQRKLLAFLREQTEKQYFLTTHSNVFLDNVLVDRVFFTRFEGRIIVDDVTSRASILDDLGYSVTDNLVSDLVILVEGPKDVPVLEEFLMKMGLYSTYDIKMWPLGGDIMGQVDLSVFVQNYNLIALVDKDPGSRKVRKKFLDKCKEFGIPVHQLKSYAIENYFTIRALRDVFGNQVPEGVVQIDPKTKLEDQIGINVKNNNRRLAKEMSLEEIKGTDFEEFLNKIANLCKASK